MSKLASQDPFPVLAADTFLILRRPGLTAGAYFYPILYPYHWPRMQSFGKIGGREQKKKEDSDNCLRDCTPHEELPMYFHLVKKWVPR